MSTKSGNLGENTGIQNVIGDSDETRFSEKWSEIDLFPNEEEILREKRHKLYKYRAAEIDGLARVYDRACGLLTGSCDDAGKISEAWKYMENFNERWKYMENFNERWKHFVDIHEQYYSLRDKCERQ